MGLLADKNYVSSQLSDNSDSKEFWEAICRLLKANTLLTPEVMKLIFSLMRNRLSDYLSQKSKSTWGYLMNKLGARPTRSKLYFNVLKDFSDKCTLDELLEIKNELSSIKRIRFNSIIPSQLSDLLGNLEIFDPAKLDLYFNKGDDLTFKDVLEILRGLRTTGVISYFDGLLGNAVNRTYAITKNKEKEIDLEYKVYLTFILLKLNLYRAIDAFFELKQNFSNCPNLIEINSKLGDDISKAKSLDKKTLDKELESATQLFVSVEKAFREQSNSDKIKCINKGKVNEKDVILETIKILQISDDKIKSEIKKTILSEEEKMRKFNENKNRNIHEKNNI